MTDRSMTLIAERMFGAPLMIEPQKAETIARVFGPRVMGVGSVVPDLSAEIGQPARSAGSILSEGLSDYAVSERAGYIKHRGVAVIEVVGSLVRRGSWMGQSSGMTSYEGLRAALKAAAADPEMKAIALEFDSPGGEAAGAFELANLVREINAVKPVYGFCEQYAYSAAYALASQCSYLIVPEYGGAGSIGVIMMHVDQSSQLEKQGLSVTIIRAGDRKAEGNSVEPLPDALRAEWQKECDAMRVSFCDLVGRGRGDRFDMAAALKTEAKAFSGSEAVRLGLADRVANPKQAFDAMVASINATGGWDGTVPDISGRSALGSSGCETGVEEPQIKEEANMADKTKEPETKVETGAKTTKATTVDSAQTQATPEAGNPDASAIIALVARVGLDASFANDLVQSGASYATASNKVIDALADKRAGQDGGDIANHAPDARVVADGVDRMKAGMSEALLAKAGHPDGKRNEFSSMSLREMARATLEARGLTGRFSSVQQMVGAAFVPHMAGGLHTTSDFGNVLADVANKSMLRAYQEAQENFEKFTKRGTLTDFKPSKRVGTGLFPGLDEVAEHAEFTYGTMGDFSETIVLATYGKLFAISRQAVINDDLGAFTTVPEKMGRASKRTVAALVYGILNGNPAMSDSTALFHADHSNLAASGAAPSEATIDAGLQAMATQKPRETADDDASLNIQPKYLLAPFKHRSAVLSALMSEKTPDTTGNKSSQRYNTVYQAAEPIFDSRITGDKWFLAADPQAFDTIEVAYLDGVDEPFIEQQDGWTVDGTEFKVRLDAAAAPMAWEGLYMNAGS